MADEKKYVMEICELCRKPIGYGDYATDGSGKQPIHTECLSEADLKARGFIPAGRILREHFRSMTTDLIPPDKCDKGHD
jgi:hypothetical protein